MTDAPSTPATPAWESAPKPWDKSIAAHRYIFGPTIALRALAKEAGRGEATLIRWSSEGDWVERRLQYESEVMAETHRKSVEALTSAASEMPGLHLRSWADMRQKADQYIDTLDRVLTCDRANEDLPPELQAEWDRFLQIGGRTSISTFTSVLQTAIAGERQAAHLDLVDPTVLEKAANRRGLMLVSGSEID